MLNQPLPPCQAACPIHQDVREYINQISKGNFTRALEVILDVNPMPASLGAICAHHCEDECRRKDVDEALSIRGLKCFAVEKGVDAPLPKKAVPTGKRVAVIGSGPAGLTAAQTLSCLGHQVAVFEREKAAGGALRNYIPFYRLTDATIDKDIDYLQRLGVEFKNGLTLGDNLDLEDLKKEYDAVILSLGLPTSKGLPIPGCQHSQCRLALPFLYDVKHKGHRLSGEDVIVIGGGNVAMDVARSAIRAGAGSVQVACLESREEMPAFEWEIEEAKEEGARFFPSVGPVEILTENDEISGLKVKACTAVFDEHGRFSPTFDESQVSVIKGNMVIFSIGQGSDFTCLEGCDVSVDERNRLVFDPDSMSTTDKGVFACGEMVTGPGTAVQSMANGRKAAVAVDGYLKQEAVSMPEEPEALPQLVEEVAEQVRPITREALGLVEAEKRVTNFDPIELGYSVIQGLKESRRCLRCGNGAEQIEVDCAHCLTCLRTCPYDVPVVNKEGKVELRQDVCQSCGLCLAVCPASTIKFKAPELEEAEAAIDGVLQDMKVNGEPRVLILTCAYAPFAMDWYNGDFFAQKPANVELVKFPCVAKIDTLHMLQAFNGGADALLIAGCAEDGELTCPYYDVSHWTSKRVERVKGILKEVDFNPESVSLLFTPPLEGKEFADKVASFLENLKG